MILHYYTMKDKVLVKKLPLPTMTQSGLILPPRAVEVPQLGHVKALGSINPDELVVGDLVMFRKFEGQRIYLDEEEIFVFRLDDILAVIRD